MHSTVFLDVSFFSDPLEDVARMTAVFEANGGGGSMPPCEPLSLPAANAACMQSVVDEASGGRVVLYVDTGTFVCYVHVTLLEYALGDDLPPARDIAIPVADAVMDAA